MEPDSKPIVYIPKGAKINVDKCGLDSPKTKYEERRKIFDLNAIRKLVGGIYGKRDQ